MVITILSEFKFLVTCSSCTRRIEVTVIFPSSVQNSKSYVTLSSIYSLLLERYEFLLCNDCINFFGKVARNYGIENVHFQYLWSDSVFEKYILGSNSNQNDMVSIKCNTAHCFIKRAHREMLKKICRPKKFVESKSQLAPIFNLPFVGGEIRVFFDRERERFSKIGGTFFDMMNKMKRKGKKQTLNFQYSTVDRAAARCSSVAISEAGQSNQEEPADNIVSTLRDQRRDGNLVTTLTVYYNDFQFSVTCNGCMRRIEIAVIMPPSAQYSQTYIPLKNIYSLMLDQFEFLFCEVCFHFIDQFAIDCEIDNSIFQRVWSDTLLGTYIRGINFNEDILITVQYSCNHCFLGVTNRDTYDRMCNFKNCIEFRPRTENMQLVHLESIPSTSTSGVEAEQTNNISNFLDPWEQQNIAAFKRFFSGSTSETTRAEQGEKNQNEIRLRRSIEISDSDSSLSYSDDDLDGRLVLRQPFRGNPGDEKGQIHTFSTDSDGGSNDEDKPANCTNNMPTVDHSDGSTNGMNGAEQGEKNQKEIPLQYSTEASPSVSNSEDDSDSSSSSDDDNDVGAKLALLQPSRRNIELANKDIHTRPNGESNDQTQTATPNSNVPTVEYFDRLTNGTNRPKREDKKKKELFLPCSTEVDSFMSEDSEQLHNVWIPNSLNEISYNTVDDDSDSSSDTSDDNIEAELILIQSFGVTRHIRLRNEDTSLTDQNETANRNNQPRVDYSDGSVRILIYESEEESLSDESEDDKSIDG